MSAVWVEMLLGVIRPRPFNWIKRRIDGSVRLEQHFSQACGGLRTLHSRDHHHLAPVQGSEIDGLAALPRDLLHHWRRNAEQILTRR